LLSDGRRVRVVARSGRASVPPGVEVVAPDITDPEAAKIACDDDDVYGQAWHVPSAPALPVRTVLEMIYKEAGHPLKVRTGTGLMLNVLGLFEPNLREMKEMLSQWTRPYLVDHKKFAARFWDDYTPLEVGIAETVRWVRSSSSGS
jgi:nucleoside-diphosphate-sugar epimerase